MATKRRARNAGPRSVRKTMKRLKAAGYVPVKRHRYGPYYKGKPQRAKNQARREGPRGYRVSTTGGRWKYFTTLADANDYANSIFQKTGRFVAVEMTRKFGRGFTKLNAPRVKGRKVKGGRAVSLRNFTGTIVRKSDGTVNILGRGRKR